MTERQLVSKMFEALQAVRRDTRFFDLLKDTRVAVAAITDNRKTADTVEQISILMDLEEGR